MTTNLPRRALLAASAILAAPAPLRAQAAMRLVVIGGGFGGASAANFARRTYPDVIIAARATDRSHAHDLMARGVALSETALRTGYADQSHLTRDFAAIYGVTPARYRTAFA